MVTASGVLVAILVVVTLLATTVVVQVRGQHLSRSRRFGTTILLVGIALQTIYHALSPFGGSSWSPIIGRLLVGLALLFILVGGYLLYMSLE